MLELTNQFQPHVASNLTSSSHSPEKFKCAISRYDSTKKIDCLYANSIILKLINNFIGKYFYVRSSSTFH